MRSWFVRFAGCVALVLTATACLDPENGCTPTSCPEETVCDTETLACVYRCEPTCAAHQYCTATGTCAQRYESVTLVKPAQSSFVGKSAPVETKLNLVGAVTQYPQGGTVRFNATHLDGQDAGSGTLTAGQNGTFTGTWSVPGETGTFKIAATHLESGLASATHQVTLDTKPPTFDFFKDGPNRTSGVAGQRANENDPQLDKAWKRDEVATIYVRADEPIETTSAQFRLWTVNNDGGIVAGAPQTYVLTPATGTQCGGKPYCGLATVDLADLDIPVFRGQLHIAASGNDVAGNLGTADAGVPVSRLSWALTIDGGTIFRGAPAVGRNGNIYVVSANVGNTDGWLTAVAPSGQTLWQAYPGASVTGAIVGAPRSGTETVYVVGKKTNSNISAFDASDGGRVGPSACIEYSGMAEATPTLVDSGGNEAIVALIRDDSNAGHLGALRAFAPTNKCIEYPSVVAPVAANRTLISIGSAVYRVNENGELVANDGADLLLAEKIKVDMADTTGGSAVRGSAPGELLFGMSGGTRAVFSVGSSDAGTKWVSSNLTSSAVGISVDNDSTILVAATDGLKRVTPSGAAATVAALGGGVMTGAPVIGADGRAYTITSGGRLQSWNSDALEWEWPSGTVVSAPLNIDCVRSSDGGVATTANGKIYVLSESGILTAVLVDSPGIDVTADWPRWQHDPANTGNASISLSQFSCE